MKIFLLFLLFLFFICVAICVWFLYYIRFLLYKDMVYISKYLKNNISFNKKDIKTLLSETSKNISIFTRNLVFDENRNVFYFKKSDIEYVNEFFDSLGKGDVSWERNNIDFYLNTFEDMKQESCDSLHKNGVVYFKLILGLGLALCVMLI
ncbi:MAG: hypothetical protein IJW59_04360 [Clostridia bacterium]|nr:hypothetical protein [Clostridia bacterium]